MSDSFTYDHEGIKDVVYRDVSLIVVITMDKDVNTELEVSGFLIWYPT